MWTIKKGRRARHKFIYCFRKKFSTVLSKCFASTDIRIPAFIPSNVAAEVTKVTGYRAQSPSSTALSATVNGGPSETLSDEFDNSHDLRDNNAIIGKSKAHAIRTKGHKTPATSGHHAWSGARAADSACSKHLKCVLCILPFTSLSDNAPLCYHVVETGNASSFQKSPLSQTPHPDRERM